jgi:hypothetical protein
MGVNEVGTKVNKMEFIFEMVFESSVGNGEKFGL